MMFLILIFSRTLDTQKLWLSYATDLDMGLLWRI